MEISIKSNKDIEELADDIISLSDITTSTSEVKAQIINLINDHLYHKIKNVTLSTIIKDQFEEDEPETSKTETENKTSPQPSSAQSVAETKKTIENTNDIESISPADIFGAAPTEPEEPEEQAKEQNTEPPTISPEETSSTSTSSANDPRSQYEKLGEPATATIVYNGNSYEIAQKVIKAGVMKGQTMLVAQHHVDPADNQILATNKQALVNYQNQIKQLTSKDQGQTTAFYNVKNALLYSITSKETMNQYINDLDEALELLKQTIQNANSSQPAFQTTATPVQPQPVAQPTEMPKVNSDGVNLAKPF